MAGRGALIVDVTALGPLFAGLAAGLHAALTLWLLLTLARRRHWPRGVALGLPGATAVTALWAAMVALDGPFGFVTVMAQGVRDLGWIGLILAVALSQVGEVERRRGLAAIALALCLLAVAMMIDASYAMLAGALPGPTGRWLVLSLLTGVGGIILIDQLIRTMPGEARRPLLATLGGIGAMWGYQLNLYLIGHLTGGPPGALLTFQPLFIAGLTAPVAIDAFDRGDRRLRLSRAVTYRAMIILAVSFYLVGLGVLAAGVRLVGGDYAQLAQTAFLGVMMASGIGLVASGRLRAWMQVMLAKHFYEHRYDYRESWLRFARAMGAGGAGTLADRTGRAIAEVVSAPAAILFTPDGQGGFEPTGHHRWGDLVSTLSVIDSRAAHALADSGRIIALDEVRGGQASALDMAATPAWLAAIEDGWALIPLGHGERLTGIALLARPIPARAIDWEDFDVLRVVGQQAGAALAEQQGQAALADARQFEAFNKRFAFMLHDVKNITSQLSLLASNIERHGDKPAFRADMLRTLRGSVERMTQLLARLSRADASHPITLGPHAVAPLVEEAVAERAGSHPVVVRLTGAPVATCDPTALRQIVGHLVQNAVEASPPGLAVEVTGVDDGHLVSLCVTDSGQGMDAEFIRTRLFQPFASTKPTGFGIGLYEARALAGAMGGRLDVASQPGVGTRFTLTLPRVGAEPVVTTGGTAAPDAPSVGPQLQKVMS